MFGSGKKGNAAKKAYEIAYALFRVSAKISESSVKEKLESKAVDLLVSANAEEYGNAAKAVAAIDCLVRIAVDLNIISISNGDILLREIGNMNETIIECMGKSEDVDVSKFFNSAPKNSLSVIPAEAGIQVSSSLEKEGNLDPVLERGDEEEKRDDVQSGNPAGGALKSGNRQIAILDKIRQSGKCKLREIQEILSDCSERTIRYDLEDLIERNLVERVGAGGPAISYRIRQII